MRWTVRTVYWLWRAPTGQTLVLISVLATTLYFAFFHIAKADTESQLVVVGIGAAALIAIWGVVNQWAISRRQLTVQFMRELETDHDYIEATALFHEATQHELGIARFAKNAPDAKHERKVFLAQSDAVRLVLNQDELIAIGIKNSILDYRVICSLSRTAFQKRYDHSRTYISELRTTLSVPTMYIEVQRLAYRLRNDDLHSIL